MLWLNSRAVYASPDCSPPNFTKVVLGVNIHMHTMATKRVHKWLDYITNERPSHRTSVQSVSPIKKTGILKPTGVS